MTLLKRRSPISINIVGVIGIVYSQRNRFTGHSPGNRVVPVSSREKIGKKLTVNNLDPTSNGQDRHCRQRSIMSINVAWQLGSVQLLRIPITDRCIHAIPTSNDRFRRKSILLIEINWSIDPLVVRITHQSS